MRPGQDPLKGDAPRGGHWAGGRPIPRSFFDRPAAVVARALLGSTILGEELGAIRAARIVETEAYVGRDRASHAFRGPTPRNRSMFGPAGRWYVYRIHQVFCANVTTGGHQAVLLRGAVPISGGDVDLGGPGRLARWFGFGRDDDGGPVRTGRVRLLPGEPPAERILVGPRVGLSVAKRRPLRYALQGSPGVSRPRPAGWSPERSG